MPEGTAQAPAITPAAVYDMMLAYKTTAVLSTGIELGVFDEVAKGAGAEQIATALGLNLRGIRLLLNALAAMGLVESDGASYWLADGVEPLLVRGRPGYVGDMIKVMASRWEWDALTSLPDAVRRGGTVLLENAETPGYAYWQDFAAHADAVAAPSARLVADLLARWASDRPRLDILDMACGHGLYGYTLAERMPRARVWSQDWPNVLPLTLARAERMGIGDRVTALPGDMFTVDLAGPYDVVMITNVLHHFNEARGVELLTRAAKAMAPDGKIVVVGFTVGEGFTRADAAAHLFSILMLIWTMEGEVHSTDAYDGMLAAAGFKNVHMHGVPGIPLRVIVADKD